MGFFDSHTTLSDSTTTWTYTYNSDGLRTKRTNGAKTYTYTYIDGQLSYMSINGSAVYFTHDGLGQPMSISYCDTTYFYVTNLQGDVIAILNTTGTAVVNYTYDAWGNVLSCTGTMAATLGADNPLRYRGYVYDTETGLYYLQSRYYNPEIGRFINADGLVSTGQGILGNNMFAYCGNNPINLYDPDGMCSRLLGFLWKIDCGKATCKDSRNYNPNPQKVAVIYDGNTSGYMLGLIMGEGFNSQGQWLVNYLKAYYRVESYSYRSMGEFVKKWNSLGSNYDKIFIMSHGYPGGLSCDGHSIGAPGLEDYSFENLKQVSAKTVYLYSCNGATKGPRGSAAYYFARLTGGAVWAARGSLNYLIGTGIPWLEFGADWTVTLGRAIRYQ